ncbi:hypothetical protein N8Z03_00510 [Pelagibacteraceae bacterium]|nr:hypothetical protein [Pelagibacteraceae bacterium]
MKKILNFIVIFVLFTSNIFAADKIELPKCMGDDFTIYNNCYGTLTWPDGQKYVGEWKDGKQHGQGTLTWPDGEKFVGEWKDDKRNGQGTLT